MNDPVTARGVVYGKGLTGSRNAVEATLQALEGGPSQAQISRVEVNWQPAEDMYGFGIR